MTAFMLFFVQVPNTNASWRYHLTIYWAKLVPQLVLLLVRQPSPIMLSQPLTAQKGWLLSGCVFVCVFVCECAFDPWRLTPSHISCVLHARLAVYKTSLHLIPRTHTHTHTYRQTHRYTRMLTLHKRTHARTHKHAHTITHTQTFWSIWYDQLEQAIKYDSLENNKLI